MASSSRAVLLLVRHSCGGAAASACSNVRQVGSRALHRGKGVMQSAAAGHPPLGHPVGKRTCEYCCKCMFHTLTMLQLHVRKSRERSLPQRCRSNQGLVTGHSDLSCESDASCR